MAATERMQELLPANLAGRFDLAPKEVKPRVMFPAKDETFQHVLQLQGNTNKNTTKLCFRCKISECPGVAQCIFDLNVLCSSCKATPIKTPPSCASAAKSQSALEWRNASLI